MKNWTLNEIQISYKPVAKMNTLNKITGSSQAADILRQAWSDDIEHHESVYIICLAHSGRVLGVKMISSGGISSCIIDPKIVFQTALAANASSIILAHNHPSGTLEPSKADKDITEKIKNGGKFLEISVLDHIILTDDAYYSFADNGMM